MNGEIILKVEESLNNIKNRAALKSKNISSK